MAGAGDGRSLRTGRGSPSLVTEPMPSVNSVPAEEEGGGYRGSGGADEISSCCRRREEAICTAGTSSKLSIKDSPLLDSPCSSMVPLLLSFSQFSAILGLRVCVASTEEVRATSMQDLELQLDYSIDAEEKIAVFGLQSLGFAYLSFQILTS